MLDRVVIDFLLHGEVGDEYDPHPCWPGGDSGITIGVGYDLGQGTRATFVDDWGAELGDVEIVRLGRVCGVRSANAQRLLPSVRSVVVPWDAALRVFEFRTVPQVAAQTCRVFPHAEHLPAQVYGALVSVVYNRGGSLTGDRRTEMAAIALAIEAGDYAAIPILIRSMARLWEGTPIEEGMRNRRYAEAAFAEAGLA